MSWWESAYRHGNVRWDPGAYDGHLPWLLQEFDVGPCVAVDVGCGTGKSAVWLVQRGFTAVGIDMAPTAIRQARELARDAGVAVEEPRPDVPAEETTPRRSRHRRTPPATARFILGVFPQDFPRELDGRAGLVTERGFLQHQRSGHELGRALARIAELLTPTGILYSLITAREGNRGRWGPPLWRHEEIESSFRRYLRIETIRHTVFTPGERGSMAAWLTVARRRNTS